MQTRVVAFGRRAAIVLLLAGLFLTIPSLQGFGLAAGQNSRAAGSPAQQADELATIQTLELSARP